MSELKCGVYVNHIGEIALLTNETFETEDQLIIFKKVHSREINNLLKALDSMLNSENFYYLGEL